MKSKEFKKSYILITVIAILILFGFNGNISTLGLDEAMYMTSSFEMSESKNYMVPQFNYEHFYDKPPLVYWLQTGIFEALDKFFGEKRLSDKTDRTKKLKLCHKEIIIPNKFLYDSKLMLFRVPASLICLIFLWCIIFSGKKIFGNKCGIYAGYSFLLCPLTAALGKMAIMDMILSFFIFLTLIITLMVYLKKINPNYMVLSWVFMALACLTKGPVALFLCGVIYLIFLLIKKRIKNLFTIQNLIGVILFFAIVSPWFIKMQILSNNTFFYEFFIHQNLQRAAGQDFGHNFPIYSYIFIIALGLIPWSFYLIPSMIKYKFNNPNHVSETFLTVWICFVFIFFTSLVGKLPGYIFPLFAPSALLIGKFFGEFKFSKGLKIWSICGVIISSVLGIAFMVGLFLLNYQTLFAKISMIISGLFMLIFGLISTIKILKKENPIKYHTIQMSGFLIFFVIGLYAITSNPCNTLDEIDSKYDLGTGSYSIAREFNLINLPKHIKIYACGLSPLWISYPLNFERPVEFIDKEDIPKLKERLPEQYFIIGKDSLPSNIEGERIENHPLFTGNKHKYIFIKNY